MDKRDWHRKDKHPDGRSQYSEQRVVDLRRRPEGKGVVRIASVAALGGFLFGYDSAVINGANAAIEEQFNADARRARASRWRPRCSAPPPAR